MIKLESGNYYRNTGVNYWFNGRKIFDTESPDDLISEAPNPNEQPMTSDYHLQRAIDLLGSLDDVEWVKKYPKIFTYIINVAHYIAQHEPEPVDPVVVEARRRVEKYYGDPVGSLDSGVADDYAIMKLAIDALRFNIADLEIKE